jgi:hypothetical protein
MTKGPESSAKILRQLSRIFGNFHASLTEIGFNTTVENSTQVTLLYQKLNKHWLMSSIRGIPAILSFCTKESETLAHFFGPKPSGPHVFHIFVDLFPNVLKFKPVSNSAFSQDYTVPLQIPRNSTGRMKELCFSKIVNLDSLNVGQITGEPFRVDVHEERFTDYLDHQNNKRLFKTISHFLDSPENLLHCKMHEKKEYGMLFVAICPNTGVYEYHVLVAGATDLLERKTSYVV